MTRSQTVVLSLALAGIAVVAYRSYRAIETVHQPRNPPNGLSTGSESRIPSKSLTGLPAGNAATTRAPAGGLFSNLAAPEPVKPGEISVKAGLLSLSVHDRSLRSVLDEITRQSGIPFDTTGLSGDERVTEVFEDLPLAPGMRGLLASWDVFFLYGANEREPRSVWIYPKGAGVSRVPSAPERWAHGNGTEVDTGESELKQQIKALEQLALRDGAAALPGLMAALDDPDARVRQAALDAAAGANLTLAPEVLIPLAQNDPSPAVRFQAMVAIADQADAAPDQIDLHGLANRAETDTDPGVRALARNLLDRINAGDLADDAMP